MLEDLHHADAGTRAFATFLARVQRPRRVCLVATFQPDEVTRSHPLTEELATMRAARRPPYRLPLEIGLVFGLGLLGTGLAYVIYYYIVENLGAVAAAGVTYIPPVVALVIGVFLAGDVIHPLGYLATALILSGVALLQYCDAVRLPNGRESVGDNQRGSSLHQRFERRLHFCFILRIQR